MKLRQCVAMTTTKTLPDSLKIDVFQNISSKFEHRSLMNLHSSPLLVSTELFSRVAVEKAIEKSSRVLHDEAIQKAVATEKLARKMVKRLHFSQFSCLEQSSKHPSQETSRKSSVRGSSSRLLPAPRLLPPRPIGEGGRSFEGSVPPSQPQVEGVLVRHWSVWQSYGAEGWTGGAPSWLPGSVPPPPTCVTVTLGVYVVCSGVSAGSCSQGGGLLDASEECNCMYRPAQSRLSQPSLSGAAGDRRPVYSEWLCHPDQVPDGDSSVSIGVDSELRLDILHRPQRYVLYFQIPIHLDSRLYLRFVVEGRVIQFRALFRPIYSTKSVHQGILPDIRVGSSARGSPPSVSG